MKLKLSLLGISVAAALAGMSGQAAASAFALLEQGGAGNAFAGGAAGAEDASIIFSNPAGMSRLNGTQVTVGASMIRAASRFSDGGSTGALLQTAGGNGDDAGGTAFVANTYIVMELDPAVRFGLGVFAPFGLQTEYDPIWIGRFQAIKSRIETVNLNPSLSYRMNDSVSLGIGLSYQHISGELTNAVNYSAAAFAADPIGGTVLAAIGGPGVEGVSTMTGSDSSWGYNFGALFNVSPDTRIGISYRSKIKYTLNGTVTFNNVPVALAGTPALANGAVNLPISMPDSFSLSAFHQMGNWDLMADATRTGWSVLQQMAISRSDGTNVQTVPEHWKDTWRIAFGASYHYNEQWLSRIGVAHDQTPMSDAYRTARIPDSDRTWLTFGGQYKMSASNKIDLSYTHIFMKDASIASDQTATGAGNLVGTYSNNVNILNAQFVHNF
jgi:long-chain fatty acid transport protein